MNPADSKANGNGDRSAVQVAFSNVTDVDGRAAVASSGDSSVVASRSTGGRYGED